MRVHTGDNKLVIIREPKTIYFDLLNIVGNNLNHDTHFIIKHNEFLAEYKTKNEIS